MDSEEAALLMLFGSGVGSVNGRDDGRLCNEQTYPTTHYYSGSGRLP